jgi:hypothetical protein
VSGHSSVNELAGRGTRGRLVRPEGIDYGERGTGE